MGILTYIGIQIWTDEEPPTPPPSPSTACKSPDRPAARVDLSPSPGVRQATVVNTWSSKRCQDIGVRPRVDPRRSEQTYPGFHIGDPVTVVCYRRDGTRIVDADTQEPSSVWYRMDDGRWLSGLFLELQDGRRGTTPPSDMPVCKR